MNTALKCFSDGPHFTPIDGTSVAYLSHRKDGFSKTNPNNSKPVYPPQPRYYLTLDLIKGIF